MVEVMKIMVKSFKRCHAGPAIVSAPTLQQVTTNPLLHRDSWTLTGKSWSVSYWSLLLSVGSRCALGSVVPSKSLFPQSCGRSGSSVVC